MRESLLIVVVSLLTHLLSFCVSQKMATAVAAIAAEALLAEVPDLDQMLTMCGFTEMIERARLINRKHG
jgi:hypothetical protein